MLSALDGINGTVFAYGQTGSGKTFTMTGGAQRYVDRGIIPRAIGLIYSELGKRSDCTYTVRPLQIGNRPGCTGPLAADQMALPAPPFLAFHVLAIWGTVADHMLPGPLRSSNHDTCC